VRDDRCGLPAAQTAMAECQYLACSAQRPGRVVGCGSPGCGSDIQYGHVTKSGRDAGGPHGGVDGVRAFDPLPYHGLRCFNEVLGSDSAFRAEAQETGLAHS
jgi:hypothetical protein